MTYNLGHSEADHSQIIGTRPMDQQIPAVFISYSHADRTVARRIARRLTAHGIRVWIDDVGLRVGDTLTTSIRAHIEDADALIVVASEKSSTSEWVKREIDFSRTAGKSIIPFFLEPLDTYPKFRDHLGVDATYLPYFAAVLHRLMADLFGTFGLKLPPPDFDLLEIGLRQLAREEQNLSPLVLGTLDGEGWHQENMDTVFDVPFHALDEAIDGLFELHPNNIVAYQAAYSFSEMGAGSRPLSSWIKATGDGELPLATAVGGRPLKREHIPAAIDLLSKCDPPNNHALYTFIENNSAEMDEQQRRSVIRLSTWPVRVDTANSGDVLAWVASRHFPDSPEIQQMWSRWVRDGAFDGGMNGPKALAKFLLDAQSEDLPGWEPINESLRNHVRSCLRSRDRKKVMVAILHIQATADAGAPIVAALLEEARDVSGTAEWSRWEKEDPETADLMRWSLFHVTQQARGDRDWPQALKDAEAIVAFEKQAGREREA